MLRLAVKEEASPVYECDKCGACCGGHLIVECDASDVAREPKLMDAKIIVSGLAGMLSVTIACGKPCLFLGRDSLCSIYETRPACCADMQAGQTQCQDARKAAGLEALLPKAMSF